MPGAMAAVARPGILARIGHHRGPHRVGLDVPQNDEQVVAVLDDRGSEAALPDVAAGSLSPVVPPGVSDGQGLEDGADRLPGGRLEKQMKMVGHQAVAEERERIPHLGAGEIAKEHITPASKFRMLLHTNPTRERGECLGTRAGALEDM